MSESVPGIDDYVSGANCSAEGRTQGLTHGFIMTFADAAARDAYIVHPEHERFKARALPCWTTSSFSILRSDGAACARP